jgi:hypothetical protein
MPTPLKWVSTPSLGQGRASGGSAAAELFEAGTAQRKRPLLETLVREVCQNSCDRRLANGKARVFFDLLLVSGEEREQMLKALDWEGLKSHIEAVKGMGGAALTLRAGLEALAAPTLVCLRISDSSTEGLTGDDWDEEGNFRRLCVHNFSTGDESGRGGSFGLGKDGFGIRPQDFALDALVNLDWGQHARGHIAGIGQKRRGHCHFQPA